MGKIKKILINIWGVRLKDKCYGIKYVRRKKLVGQKGYIE